MVINMPKNMKIKFLHLADAFIQSELTDSGYFLSVHVFPGNRTHNLYTAKREMI